MGSDTFIIFLYASNRRRDSDDSKAGARDFMITAACKSSILPSSDNGAKASSSKSLSTGEMSLHCAAAVLSMGTKLVVFRCSRHSGSDEMHESTSRNDNAILLCKKHASQITSLSHDKSSIFSLL